jgi:FkbM family methyltransferase
MEGWPLRFQWVFADDTSGRDSVIRSGRQATSLALLQGLAWASQRFSHQPVAPGLHRLRVLGGPLRGMYISTPALTRLSFPLGTYQRDVLKAMRSHVVAGTTVYDVGAHMGYFALVLSRLVGPEGHVIAFEPDPHNLEALNANLATNGILNVTVAAAAVADQSAEVSFATFPFSSVSHIADGRTPADARRITVTAVTLDSCVYEDGHLPPSFMKIDVEGAEARVLRGAKRILREAAPVVIAEVWRAHWPEVAELMLSHGYRAHVLGGESRMATAGLADVLFLPDDRTPVD